MTHNSTVQVDLGDNPLQRHLFLDWMGARDQSFFLRSFRQIHLLPTDPQSSVRDRSISVHQEHLFHRSDSQDLADSASLQVFVSRQIGLDAFDGIGHIAPDSQTG